MKELIIHIGTHKTGTTSIQKFLNSRAKELKNLYGLLVLKIDQPNLLNDIMYADGSNVDSNSQLRNKLKNIIKIHPKIDRFILSSEALSGNPRDYYSNVYYSAEVLSNTVQDLFDNITIVLFVRRQDDFLQSWYTQLCHNNISVSLDDYIDLKKIDSLDWNQIINAYNQSFTNCVINVVPYDRNLFAKIELREVFLKVIGVDENLISHEKQYNIGFSSYSTEIAKRSYPYLTEEEQLSLRYILQEFGNKGISNEYNLIKPSLKEQIVEKFRHLNADLFKKYVKDKYELSNFSEPIFHSTHEKDSIRELIAALLVQNQKLQSRIIDLEEFKLRVYNMMPIRLLRKMRRLIKE